MHFVTLPEARSDIPPAFTDPNAARKWLKSLPQTQPLALLIAITEQTCAIDASPSPTDDALALIDCLRQGAVVAAEALAPRFLRKPLPLPPEDMRCFDTLQDFWLAQAFAYLRRVPQLPPRQRALPLHRAASSLRQAQLAHFQAAQEIDARLDHLLLACLGYAEQAGCLRNLLADPAFRHLGEDSIAGHLAWAFMLRICDPYRFSSAQLAVVNRTLSRWRELADFLDTEGDTSPPTQAIDLGTFLLGDYPEGLPRWLGLRKVQRKIRQRLDALAAGESPETLKLGRELSSSAAISLLRLIASELSSPSELPMTEMGNIELIFGPEHAYAVFTGEALNRSNTRLAGSSAPSQQRAIFGGDHSATQPAAINRMDIPREAWQLVDGFAIRPQHDPSARHLAPCLIAKYIDKVTTIGVLEGLREARDGSLSASLRWFDEALAAVRLLRPGRPGEYVPAFLLGKGDTGSLITPTGGGLRLEGAVRIEGFTTATLTVGRVLERGSDFVRYAVQPP